MTINLLEPSFPSFLESNILTDDIMEMAGDFQTGDVPVYLCYKFSNKQLFPVNDTMG